MMSFKSLADLFNAARCEKLSTSAIKSGTWPFVIRSRMCSNRPVWRGIHSTSTPLHSTLFSLPHLTPWMMRLFCCGANLYSLDTVSREFNKVVDLSCKFCKAVCSLSTNQKTNGWHSFKAASKFVFAPLWIFLAKCFVIDGGPSRFQSFQRPWRSLHAILLET